MANIPVSAQAPNRNAGLTISYTTMTTTDTYLCEVSSGTELLKFSNSGGAPVTITIAPQQQVEGVSLQNRTVTVAAGSDVVWGNVPVSSVFVGSGRVYVTASAACKLAVLRQ